MGGLDVVLILAEREEASSRIEKRADGVSIQRLIQTGADHQEVICGQSFMSVSWEWGMKLSGFLDSHRETAIKQAFGFPGCEGKSSLTCRGFYYIKILGHYMGF